MRPGESSSNREVLCPKCGGKFFEKSLPFHLKTCEPLSDELFQKLRGDGLTNRERELKGLANTNYTNTGPLAPKEIECEYCKKLFFPSSINMHYKVCEVLHPELALNSRPRSARPASRRFKSRGNRDDDGNFNNNSNIGPNSNFTGIDYDLHRGRSQSPINKDDGAFANRVGAGMINCRICGRHFTMDRIEKHESICIKLSWNQKTIKQMPKAAKKNLQGINPKPDYDLPKNGACSTSNEVSPDNPMVMGLGYGTGTKDGVPRLSRNTQKIISGMGNGNGGIIGAGGGGFGSDHNSGMYSGGGGPNSNSRPNSRPGSASSAHRGRGPGPGGSPGNASNRTKRSLSPSSLLRNSYDAVGGGYVRADLEGCAGLEVTVNIG